MLICYILFECMVICLGFRSIYPEGKISPKLGEDDASHFDVCIVLTKMRGEKPQSS